ncbi:MAG: hypothetical protein PHD67_02985 [Oscillospiraceae bacterium]|nr:hypothetical protein [Oscillospiraceae bacterium]
MAAVALWGFWPICGKICKRIWCNSLDETSLFDYHINVYNTFYNQFPYDAAAGHELPEQENREEQSFLPRPGCRIRPGGGTINYDDAEKWWYI